MGARLFFGLLLLLLPLQQPPDCKKCKDSGFVPCPEEARHACSGESALHCSVAARCALCVGTHQVPCPKCKREPGPEYAAAQAANRAFLEELRPLEEPFARPLAHAQSAHFLLTYDIPALKVAGGETLHGGLHLYLERLERVFARFQSDVGAQDADFSARTQVFLWARKEDQQKASAVFARQPSDTEAKLMGRAPVVTIFYDKAWLHDEPELHQAVVHQVTHCLLSNVWDGIWPGNIHGGWIDEGLSHAYELAQFGSVRHYCYVEADTILELQRGGWEPPVRAAVDEGQAPGFVGVAGKNTTELSAQDQLFAWSYVDFLLRTHKAQFGPLARAIKAKTPLKDALAETLRVTPFQFEDQWRAFVQANYSLKEKKKK